MRLTSDGKMDILIKLQMLLKYVAIAVIVKNKRSIISRTHSQH